MIWYVSVLCFMLGFVFGKVYVKCSEEYVNKPDEACEYQVIRAYSPSTAYSKWAELRRMIEISGFTVEVIDVKVYNSNVGQKYIFYYKKIKTPKTKGAK